jgi:hypothetical protein
MIECFQFTKNQRYSQPFSFINLSGIIIKTELLLLRFQFVDPKREKTGFAMLVYSKSIFLQP